VKKILVGLLVLGSFSGFAGNYGEKIVNDSIKCARKVLYKHKGSVQELSGVVKMLQKTQTYLSSENANLNVEIGSIEIGLEECNKLNKERVVGYGTQSIAGQLPNDERPMAEKLFTLIDEEVDMSFQLRKIVKNLIERNDDYRGIGQMGRLRSLLAVPADL
jgi:hypothetical protein